MNFAITLFVLGVLAQVSLNAAAPRPYGAPQPEETKAVATDPTVNTDTTSGYSEPTTAKKCVSRTCGCTSTNDVCGCNSTDSPPPPSGGLICDCVVCNCKANKPDKKCGCKKPCACGITNPIILIFYKYLQGLSPRSRPQY